MPTCWADGCTNLSGGRNNKSITGQPLTVDTKLSFHSFPFSNPDLLQRWLINIGKVDRFPKAKSGYSLCSVHFKDDCFKDDMFARIMQLPPEQTRRRMRRLKPDAVPTEFVHRKTTQSRSSSATVKRKHRNVIGELLKNHELNGTANRKRKADIPIRSRSKVSFPITSAADKNFSAENSSELASNKTKYDSKQETVPSIVPIRVILNSNHFQETLLCNNSTRTDARKNDVEHVPIQTTNNGTVVKLEAPSDQACDQEKYIVYKSCLTQLHKFCKECGAPVVELFEFITDSMISYEITCKNNHYYVWNSQPFMKKEPV